MGEELNLIIGKKYSVRLYPQKEIIDVSYIGKTNRLYVFEEGDNLVGVNCHHAIKEKGIISHVEVSSFSIHSFPKKKVFEHPERDSELFALLENAEKLK